MNFRDRIRSEYQIYTKKKNCTTSTPTTATMASTKSGHMNVETMLIRYDTLFNIDIYSEAPTVTVYDMVFAQMAKSSPPLATEEVTNISKNNVKEEKDDDGGFTSYEKFARRF